MLEHLADLESDFSVFHRMGPVDILNLSGPRFFAMAYRLPAYSGVMAARLAAAEQATTPEAPGGTKTVDSTRESILATPELAELIEF